MVRMEVTLDLPGLLLGSQRLRERAPKSLDVQARRGSCNFLARCSHFADGELRDGERRRGLGQSLARAQHQTGSPDLGSGHPQLAVNLELLVCLSFPPLNKEWGWGGVRFLDVGTAI